MRRTRRKYQTFYALMRTRRVTLSPEHVAALNTIQTEFHDDEKVIVAYKKYIENLGGPPLPSGSNEETSRRFMEVRTDVFNEMMFEIGKSLGFNFDKRDQAKYSYASRLGRHRNRTDCGAAIGSGASARETRLTCFTISGKPCREQIPASSLGKASRSCSAGKLEISRERPRFATSPALGCTGRPVAGFAPAYAGRNVS